MSKKYLSSQNTTDICCNKLYKADVFEGLEFPKYKYSEDYWINSRIFFNCNKIITTSECLYYYLRNDKGACEIGFNDNRIDGIRAATEVKEFYKRNDESLLPYINKYILEYVLGIYSLLIEKKLFYEEEKEVIDKLKKIFDKIYLVDKKNIRKISGKKERVRFFIFSKSPNIYKTISFLLRRIDLVKKKFNIRKSI